MNNRNDNKKPNEDRKDPGGGGGQARKGSAVDALIDRLAHEGTVVGSEDEFTLDRERAKEKMREFQLADPWSYVLELVQAAVLKQALNISFDIDTDDMRMQFDGRPFTLVDFDRLHGAMLEKAATVARWDLQARRMLAVAVNSAQALEPRTIKVISCDTMTGAELVVRPGKPDEFRALEAAEVEVAQRGTTIHVKYRLGASALTRFARRMTRRLPEEKIIRDHCWCCPATVFLGLERISSKSFGEHLEGTVTVRGPGIQGVAGFVKDVDFEPRIHLIKHGVLIATHTIGTMPGFSAVVESENLRKDLSQRDFVRDRAYKELQAAVLAAEEQAIKTVVRAAVRSARRVDELREPTASPWLMRLARGPVWDHTYRPRRNWHAVWAGSGSEIFVAGTHGSTMRFDGRTWHVTSLGGIICALWGVPGSDVFAVRDDGTVFVYRGQWRQLDQVAGKWWPEALWGFSSGDMLLVRHVTIHRFDGNAWNPVFTRPGFWLSDVWGTSPSNIYAVGRKGQIAHYDGETWREMKTRVDNTLNAVFGPDESNIFAVGTRGRILRLDAPSGSWHPMRCKYSPDLRGLWGSSPSNMFAVGDGGAILHCDGEEWRRVELGITENLKAIGGTAADNIYAVGDGGTIVHHDGTGWSRLERINARASLSELVDQVGTRELKRIVARETRGRNGPPA